MTQGSYKIWPADEKGEPFGDPSKPPDIVADQVVDIYFGLPADVPQPPPKEQLGLQEEIEKTLRAVRLLYGASEGKQSKSKFRAYYVRLFRLAQLGLEGAAAAPEVAKLALDVVSQNLIEDEAPRVKNEHLQKLGRTAIIASLPFLVLYVLALLPPNDGIVSWLTALNVEPDVFASFMLLWIGCFTGVWLSYGIRTSVFTLSDLTRTDCDYLLPALRLLFAGVLTMLLGLVFMLGVVNISLGNYSVTNMSENRMLAYLIGALCGTSELLLPSIVAKRSTEFLSGLK